MINNITVIIMMNNKKSTPMSKHISPLAFLFLLSIVVNAHPALDALGYIADDLKSSLDAIFDNGNWTVPSTDTTRSAICAEIPSQKSCDGRSSP